MEGVGGVKLGNCISQQLVEVTRAPLAARLSILDLGAQRFAVENRAQVPRFIQAPNVRPVERVFDDRRALSRRIAATGLLPDAPYTTRSAGGGNWADSSR